MNLDLSVYAPPRLSSEAIALIKHFEGCFLEAYRDPVGVWTIGYGHTAHVRRGMSITPQQAENLLMEDLEISEVDVRHNVKLPLNENEFGALVSLAFNIGGSAFAHSSLVRKLNKGDRRGAAEEFERFVNGHIGGKRVMLRGLVLRRKAECEFFEAPVGGLVRDGQMILAGRTIPVDHPSYDLAQVGPPSPPQHHPYPAQAVPAAADGADEVVEREPAARPKIGRATLVSVGAGAALGAIPATDTSAAHGLVGAITHVWEQAGGPAVFPPATAWLRWVEAFRSGAVDIFKQGSLTPMLNYAAAFIQSHEAIIVFAVTVGLVLLRAGIGSFFVDRGSRQA